VSISFLTKSPGIFFLRCAQIQPPDRHTASSGGEFKNTLVGLIEFNK
jgi:hypothetical protein